MNNKDSGGLVLYVLCTFSGLLWWLTVRVDSWVVGLAVAGTLITLDYIQYRHRT